MAQEKYPEVHGNFACGEIQKHVSPLALDRHADWHLVGKESGRLLSAVVKREMRVPVVRELALEGFAEMRPLILFGAQPGVAVVSEHRVQQHQPLHEPAE